MQNTQDKDDAAIESPQHSQPRDPPVKELQEKSRSGDSPVTDLQQRSGVSPVRELENTSRSGDSPVSELQPGSRSEDSPATELEDSPVTQLQDNSRSEDSPVTQLQDKSMSENSPVTQVQDKSRSENSPVQDLEHRSSLQGNLNPKLQQKSRSVDHLVPALPQKSQSVDTRETEEKRKSRASNSETAPSSEEANDGSDLPIDRGYAWVVVFSCLFCNVVCLGLQRAYGILFVEFLVLFQLPAGVTSLVMSVQMVIASISGLVTQTVLLSLLSERQTIMTGAVFCAVGTALGHLATSLIHLLLTLGLLVGIGNAMIFGPTMVIVSKYFQRRRSFAMAICILGGNVGSMVMPLFTQALLTSLGVRKTLLVLAGTYLCCLLFGMLLRPLESNRGKRQRKEGNTDVSPPEDHQPLNQPTCNKTVTRLRSNSVSSHPRELLPPGTALGASTSELFISTEFLAGNHSHDHDDDDEKETLELQPLTSDAGDVSDTSRLRHKDADGKAVCNGVEKRTENDRRMNYCRRFLGMFDLSLFRQYRFLLIVCACSLASVTPNLYGLYLPAMAVDKGLVGQKVALLLTMFGGCGIVSRLGFGVLADVNLIPRVYLMALLLTLSCTAGLFTPLFHSFTHLMLFSASYGLFGIVYFSLMPVVVVDIMGLDNMSKTLGFVQLFQGITVAVAIPVLGHLRDVTGNYHASFYVMSGSGLLSAFLLFSFTRCATRNTVTTSTTTTTQPLTGKSDPTPV